MKKTKILYLFTGFIGFVSGIAILITFGSWTMLRNSISNLKSSYSITVISQEEVVQLNPAITLDLSTPSKEILILETKMPEQVQVPEINISEGIISEKFDRLLYLKEFHPEETVSILIEHIDSYSPELDKALAYLLIGQSQDKINDTFSAQKNYDNAISVLTIITDSTEEPIETCQAYYYLIETFILIHDKKTAWQKLDEFTSKETKLLEQAESLAERSEIYLWLGDAANLLEDTETSKHYYEKLSMNTFPELDDLENMDEIISVYNTLINSAIREADYDLVDSYSGKLGNLLIEIILNTNKVQEIEEAYYSLSEIPSSQQISYDFDELHTYIENEIELALPSLVSDEDFASAYTMLGVMELLKGNTTFAVSYLDKKVQHDPQPENILELGSMYSTSGNYGCAYKWYKEFLSFETFEIYLYRAFVEESIKHIEEIYKESEIPYCP
ncbi:MAG: hypothetical protein JEZ06_18205 [Anaerolineaceae bacterium]|nr:hypothetical protein [Anaerolineaceae bacterium]